VNPSRSPIEILSDTMSVNFDPYVQRVLHDVKHNWYGLIPGVAHPPESRKGRLSIEFAILRNGDIKDMKLVESSGDVQLDRAAWGGVTASSPLPPLPMEFGGSSLRLRFRFFYNPDKNPFTSPIERAPKSSVTLSISPPDSLEVPIGGSGVVIVTVTGTANTAVMWRITGLGCSGSACGKMQGGLYIAPQALPRPASVTLTAIAEADPTASASIAVNLIAAKSTK
jgi:TonB family protein